MCITASSVCLPCAQQHRSAARQRSGPDFRSLKVGENRDRLFVLNGGHSEHGNVLRMFVVRAVRKIEPRHVHPRAQQAVNHPRRIARRPDRAHYFGMTKAHALSRGNISPLFLLSTGRLVTTAVFFQSSRFDSSLSYLATANCALTRATPSPPFGNN